VRDVIVKEELSQYNRNFVLTTLDREDRLIKNDFCISKVKNYIKKSFEDEAAGGAVGADVARVEDKAAPAAVIAPAAQEEAK